MPAAILNGFSSTSVGLYPVVPFQLGAKMGEGAYLDAGGHPSRLKIDRVERFCWQVQIRGMGERSTLPVVMNLPSIHGAK